MIENKLNTYVSNLNFLPEVQNKTNFNQENIIIADCTLRDGEQHPGVVFTKRDKLLIARQLDKLGVHEIEVAIPAVSVEDIDAVKAITNEKFKARITVSARSTKQDVDLAKECGVYGIILSAPIGDLQRKYKTQWDNQKYLDIVLDITNYAKEKGLYIILSPYDTTRADLNFFEIVLSTLSSRKLVDRVRLVDTVGAATPESISYLTKKMREWLKEVPIEIHCHNDFGLALANTLASIASGASVISSTINGLGERAGNTSTEEAIAALKFLYGIDIGIKTELLFETSQLVEKLSGVKLQSHKSVVGDHAFSHESGMVVAGILKMPFVGEAIKPELVGQKRKILIGKGTGKTSLRAKLDELGIGFKENDLDLILGEVKKYSIQEKKSITDKELLKIVKETKK
jgi:isopropylmalate/homocitrate/citramalate synthase